MRDARCERASCDSRRAMREAVFEAAKHKLELERSELIAVIAQLVDDLEGASITVSLRENLMDVSDALAKLERGTYALCERCGHAIARERLDERPAERECSACAVDTSS